jgi:tetratricopeptide (TPR) repeat protein
VIQLSGQFVPIKLDGEKEGLAAFKKYDLHGFPSILFVDGDGKVIVSTSGYRSPADFTVLMNRVLNLKHVPDWETTLKADPTNIDALTNLGMAAALTGDMKGAADYAKQAMVLHPATPVDIASLADMFNNVGDAFQNAQKNEEAIPYFEAAANSGAETSKVAYALISEIYCYFGMSKPQLALDVANRAAALKDLSKDDAASITRLQAAAKKAVGKGSG